MDTDVVVAAMRSPRGASAEILRTARARRVTLLMSVPLAIEYESVCREAEHRLAAGLDLDAVGIYLDGLVAMAEPVETHFLWRPHLRDANDEMVLEAAVNGGADALVSFNLADYGQVPARFGVDALLPRQIIQRIAR